MRYLFCLLMLLGSMLSGFADTSANDLEVMAQSDINAYILIGIFILSTIVIILLVHTQWFTQLSIKGKFYLGFGSVLILTILVASVGIFYLRIAIGENQTAEKTRSVQLHLADLQSKQEALLHSTSAQLDRVNLLKNQHAEKISSLFGDISDLDALLEEDKRSSEVKTLISLYEIYKQNSEKVFDSEESLHINRDALTKEVSQINEGVDSLSEQVVSFLKINEEIDASTQAHKKAVLSVLSAVSVEPVPEVKEGEDPPEPAIKQSNFDNAKAQVEQAFAVQGKTLGELLAKRNAKELISSLALLSVTKARLVQLSTMDLRFGGGTRGDIKSNVDQQFEALVNGMKQFHTQTAAVEIDQACDEVLSNINNLQKKFDTFVDDELVRVSAHTSITNTLGQMSVSLDQMSGISFAKVERAERYSFWSFVVGGLALFVVGIAVAMYYTRNLSSMLQDVIDRLRIGSNEVMTASSQVSQASQQMAYGANEQASSLEETSASLEEMSSMTRKNAENTETANNLAMDASVSAEHGGDAMDKLMSVMEDIRDSSNQTAKIVKTIDDIAFQTNLLALNAAVEAARAGESGRGFAVVAEEVRSLAQRSAEAAKNTAALIDEAQQNANSGALAAEAMGAIFDKIKEVIGNVATLSSDVSLASNEQARGIDQINAAVSQMDRVTQSNAATSEESASAAEELQSQSRELTALVSTLDKVVQGGSQYIATSQESITIQKAKTTKVNRTTRVVETSWGGKKEAKSEIFQKAMLETADEDIESDAQIEALRGTTRKESEDAKPNSQIDTNEFLGEKVSPEKVIPLSEEEMKDF